MEIATIAFRDAHRGFAAAAGGAKKKFEDYDVGSASAQRLRNLSQLDAGSHRRKHYADKSIENEMRALGY